MLDKCGPEHKRRCFLVFLILMFALLTAIRLIHFRANSFSMTGLDQVENYLTCLGQTNTGRLLPHGNTASFDFGKLGPFVFYLYSLVLSVWTSPLALIGFSLIMNFATPVVLFLFFRSRRETSTGYSCSGTGAHESQIR